MSVLTINSEYRNNIIHLPSMIKVTVHHKEMDSDNFHFLYPLKITFFLHINSLTVVILQGIPADNRLGKAKTHP